MSARVTATVYSSHVPAIGVAMDLGKTDEPVETLTIEVKGEGDKGQLKILWGGTALGAGFTGK